MKILLWLAGGLVMFVHTASALTEVRQITSKKDCPANLNIDVARSEANDNLMVVSVNFTPHASKLYEGRVNVFSRLQVASDGITVFEGNVVMTKEKDGFRCRFRIHADFLKRSHITLSTQLYERDGHPTIGGGQVYEISLRGFSP